ncbi:MAG: hypothetical protein LBG52_06505 [Candidatus Peribacteria bacterium]|jgi:hypothetical protein|nr:hypothetical protein [Candidatus Peribacteria bacterium]
MTIDHNLSTMLNSLPAYLDPSFSKTVNEQINQALLIQQQIKELTQHAAKNYRKKGYDYSTHVNNILSRDSSYIPPQFQPYYDSLSAPLQQKFLTLLLSLQTYTTTPANKEPISY